MARIVSGMERLDALMRSVYGRTPDEFRTDAYRRGYEQRCEQAYEQGIKAGKRLAKGKPEYPKAKGHPKILDHGILVLQFTDFVDELMQAKGISVAAAVSQYLAKMSPLWKQIDAPVWSRKQLMSLYERAKKRKAIAVSDRAAYEMLNRG